MLWKQPLLLWAERWGAGPGAATLLRGLAVAQRGVGGACPEWDTWGQPPAPGTAGLGSPLSWVHWGGWVGKGSPHGAGGCAGGRGHPVGLGTGSPHGAGVKATPRGCPMGLPTGLGALPSLCCLQLAANQSPHRESGSPPILCFYLVPPSGQSQPCPRYLSACWGEHPVSAAVAVGQCGALLLCAAGPGKAPKAVELLLVEKPVLTQKGLLLGAAAPAPGRLLLGLGWVRPWLGKACGHAGMGQVSVAASAMSVSAFTSWGVPGGELYWMLSFWWNWGALNLLNL